MSDSGHKIYRRRNFVQQVNTDIIKIALFFALIVEIVHFDKSWKIQSEHLCVEHESIGIVLVSRLSVCYPVCLSVFSRARVVERRPHHNVKKKTKMIVLFFLNTYIRIS